MRSSLVLGRRVSLLLGLSTLCAWAVASCASSDDPGEGDAEGGADATDSSDTAPSSAAPPSGTASMSSASTTDAAADNTSSPSSSAGPANTAPASTAPASTAPANTTGTSSTADVPPGIGGAGAGPSAAAGAGPSAAAGESGLTTDEAPTAPTEAAATDAGAPSSDAETDADGGAPTPSFSAGYIMGADISGVPEQIDRGMAFEDTDGEQKDILDLLAAHGFNMIRLRTFVDPSAAYGYASDAGDCTGKSQPYNDKASTIAFAQQIKARGMGLLLDFHYSDTWADPGKQVIPETWRDDASIDDLAAHVSAYTTDVLSALVAAGATPDMVQVGNEITPGMLIHVPTTDTDCYGNNSAQQAGANGSTRNWDNLSTLLSAGVDAVREIDPGIVVMLHIENLDDPGGVVGWVTSARAGGVDFDVLGLSAYEAFQGPSSDWEGTLTMLAETFPELSFAIAEYNPQRRLLNDIMRALPDGRGKGTFFWEPTQSGSWGDAMFDFSGNVARARSADFAEYDQMLADYELR